MTFQQGQRKTDPTPYDQVIVMSQSFINQSFKRMWDRARERDGLKNFGDRNGPNGQRLDDVVFDAPTVYIPTDDTLPDAVYLVLTFNDGQAHLLTDARTRQYTDFPMRGWQLYFKMRLKQKNSTTDEPAYAAYKIKSGFSNAIFDLVQLYMDFSNPSNDGETFDAGKSSIPNVRGSINAERSLQTVMRDWIKVTANKSGMTLLGYYFASQRPNTVVGVNSSLVPRFIEYHVYPRGGTSENALALLITAGNHERPWQGKIKPWGPYAQPGRATLCINEKCFWEEWVLKDLKSVITDTELIVGKQPPLTWNNKSKRLNYGIHYRFGTGGEPGTFKFDPKWDKEGRLHWQWKGGMRSSENRINHQGQTWINKEQARSWVWVVVGHGDNATFTIKGHHYFHHSIIKGSGKKGKAGAALIWVTWLTDWEINYSVRAAQNGGVEIKRKSSKIQPIRTNLGGQKKERHNLRGYAEGKKKLLRKLLNDAMKKTSNSLRGLMQSHKFYMPTTGVFRLASPKFNNRGDLLVDLRYLRIRPPNFRKRFAIGGAHPAGDIAQDEYFPFDSIGFVSKQDPAGQPVEYEDSNDDYDDDEPSDDDDGDAEDDDDDDYDDDGDDDDDYYIEGDDLEDDDYCSDTNDDEDDGEDYDPERPRFTVLPPWDVPEDPPSYPDDKRVEVVCPPKEPARQGEPDKQGGPDTQGGSTTTQPPRGRGRTDHTEEDDY